MMAWRGIDNPGNFFLEVAKGNVPGHSIVHKYGTGILTTTPRVVTQTGVYQTPLEASSLEFVSDNANDTAAGTGAQEITFFGVDSSWNYVTKTIETNGTTAVQLPVDIFRLRRWYVSRSGTYATSTARSHAGNMTIQVSGAGTVWDTIPNTPIAYGQSVIGADTIPAGKVGYLLSKTIFVDASKTADIYLFQRPHADDLATPFNGVMRIVQREIGLQGGFSVLPMSPKGPFIGPCDVGFFGSVISQTADVSVEFELLLVDQ